MLLQLVQIQTSYKPAAAGDEVRDALARHHPLAPLPLPRRCVLVEPVREDVHCLGRQLQVGREQQPDVWVCRGHDIGGGLSCSDVIGWQCGIAGDSLHCMFLLHAVLCVS